jgi:hypothetical protein
MRATLAIHVLMRLLTKALINLAGGITLRLDRFAAKLRVTDLQTRLLTRKAFELC